MAKRIRGVARSTLRASPGAKCARRAAALSTGTALGGTIARRARGYNLRGPNLVQPSLASGERISHALSLPWLEEALYGTGRPREHYSLVPLPRMTLRRARTRGGIFQHCDSQ